MNSSMAPKGEKTIESHRPRWMELGFEARFQSFQNLMRHRIRDILLVSSLYDLYVFEEDGRLYEMIRDKYEGLNLTNAPELLQVSTGAEALSVLSDNHPCDLVLTTLHIEDMSPVEFARNFRDRHIRIPLVMLAFDNKELSDMLRHREEELFDNVFIWQGDFRLILAIIKSLEDRMNVAHDTDLMGVQSILVIEDNILYYSSFLPMVYDETMKQSQRLIEEGVNLSDRRLRMRARPKILLCKTYEEAWNIVEQYEETLLGVISDIDFPRGGMPDPHAGLALAEAVKTRHPDIPVLLHSNQPAHRDEALRLGAWFVLKDSPTLLQELRTFMIEQLSFGDFVFRMPDGREVARAHDLLSLEKALETVPEASIAYHAERNHFSNWLKARTEFWLAYRLRPQKVSDFPSVEHTRQVLIQSLRTYRRLKQRGVITDFDKETFDPSYTLARIGGGSIGGKGRGLSFINTLITNYHLEEKFKGVRLYVPPLLAIGTEIFDWFVDENDLRDFALNTEDDRAILHRFLEAKKFPDGVLRDLVAFLELVPCPISVRSSSLLEDSHIHPFAGVYRTYLLPNTHPDPCVRALELVRAIKKVYASTFFSTAKQYIKATPYRLEEEKMAIVVQKVVGSRHGNRFYPSFAGVAKSYNFYPVPPQSFTDGIANVALGLGKTVVEGGTCVRFCPKYPQTTQAFFAAGGGPRQNTQRTFYALDLSVPIDESLDIQDPFVRSYEIETAEKDGTLAPLASTYLPENDRIIDGVSRDGIRLVTFAPLLKERRFPLPEILDLLLEIGTWGMGTPVEIEFAVEMHPGDGMHEFGIMQMRPIVPRRELDVLHIATYDRSELIAESAHVLGNDVIEDIHDIVVVDRDHFDRSKSPEVAEEIRILNARLLDEGRPYLLIGVGRWGSLDPWLGIPVTWDQIAGARVIVETGFKDLQVEPSQGSHFFQNLISFQVGFFTISQEDDHHFVDWEWLLSQPPFEALSLTRHLRFEAPILVKMSARQGRGVILKPGVRR